MKTKLAGVVRGITSSGTRIQNLYVNFRGRRHGTIRTGSDNARHRVMEVSGPHMQCRAASKAAELAFLAIIGREEYSDVYHTDPAAAEILSRMKNLQGKENEIVEAALRSHSEAEHERNAALAALTEAEALRMIGEATDGEVVAACAKVEQAERLVSRAMQDYGSHKKACVLLQTRLREAQVATMQRIYSDILPRYHDALAVLAEALAPVVEANEALRSICVEAAVRLPGPGAECALRDAGLTGLAPLFDSTVEDWLAEVVGYLDNQPQAQAATLAA